MIFESPVLPPTPDGFTDRPYQAMFRVTLAAGGRGVFPFQFDSDTQTIVGSIRGMQYFSTGFAELRLRTANGEEFSNGFMPFDHVADLQQHGAAVLPAITIPPNGQLIAEVREVNGADPADLLFCFQGFKRYRK